MNCARTDLCGGTGATRFPTAIGCRRVPGNLRWRAENWPVRCIFRLKRREFAGQALVMPDDVSDLPDDLAALRAMVLKHRAELAAARSGLIEQQYEIEALKARLARLLRVTFGRSSKKLSAGVEQLDLLLSEIDEQLAEIAPTDEPVGDDTENLARKPVREPLPPALPRGVVEHLTPCGENGGCPACGGQLHAGARTRPRSLTTFRAHSVSFATCGRNCPAGPARRSFRLRCPICPSRAAARVPA